MAQLVSLEKYIELVDIRNSDGALDASSVMGVSTNKGFIETKANLTDVSLLPYKIVAPRQFAYVADTSRRGDKISLGFNDSDRKYIVSTWYVVFRVIDETKLLPEYLYLWFCRSEFDRYARTNSWGSAREYFWLEEMKRVRVPIPSIAEQRTIVDAWKSLRNIKEQNEALAAPLMQLCQSYIQECKHKYDKVAIGPYMTKGIKNSDNAISKVLGVGQSGFMSPQKIPNESLRNYKVMSRDAICYAPPLYNIKSDAIQLYEYDEPAVCSPIYEVFFINSEKILPHYLMLWLKREEFKRYAEYYALGVRNTFNYEMMEQFAIPLPPMDIQRAIVSLYQCALEYKAIAAEADAQARSICSALMQHAINC